MSTKEKVGPEAPDLSDPKKLAGWHIKNDLPHLKRGWKGALALTFVGFTAGFGLAWYLVVAAKNATIERVQTDNRSLEKDNERVARENDRLVKQNTELKTAIDDHSMPIKKRTLNLVSQLFDYAARCQTNSNNMELWNEYSFRFEYRIPKAVHDLDEIGQHSDRLTQLAAPIHTPSDPWFPTNMFQIATELQKLANNLKE